MDNKKNENGLEALEQLWKQLTPTQQLLMLRRAEALAAMNTQIQRATDPASDYRDTK